MLRLDISPSTVFFISYFPKHVQWQTVMDDIAETFDIQDNTESREIGRYLDNYCFHLYLNRLYSLIQE